MAADDLEPRLGDALLAHDDRHDGTVFIAAVHLVARLERLEGGQFLEAALLKKPHALGVAAALCFRNAKVAHVFSAVGIHLHVLHFHGAYYTIFGGRVQRRPLAEDDFKAVTRRAQPLGEFRIDPLGRPVAVFEAEVGEVCRLTIRRREPPAFLEHLDRPLHDLHA